MPSRSTIVPALVYNDAPRAVDFLCRAFGFQTRLVVPGAPGEIAHAQLTLGEGMIMLNSAKPSTRERFGLVGPAETSGLVTCCVCVVVADVDAHHAQAEAHGAKVIVAPHDNEYGGRGYEVSDEEGNLWTFMTYDPWQ